MARRPAGFVNGLKRDGDVWRIRLYSQGRIHKGTFQTAEQAQAALDWLRLKAQADRLGIPAPERPEAAPTLERVFEGYAKELEALRRPAKSIREVRQIASYWYRALGRYRTADLTRDDLVAFVAWVLNPKNTRSKGSLARKAIVILRTAFRRAGVPVPDAPRIEVPRGRPKSVPAAALVAFLRALEPGSVARTFAELVFWTGCRESEARRLTVGQVLLQQGVILFRRGKGRAGQRGGEDPTPIPRPLLATLSAYAAGLPAGVGADAPFLAISTRRGAAKTLRRRPLTDSSLRKTFTAAAAAAGLPDGGGIGWLRSQYATLAGEAGVPLTTIRDSLGHSSVVVTERHYDESRRWQAHLDAAQAIERIVSAAGYSPGTTTIENGPTSPSGGPSGEGRSIPGEPT